MHTLEEFEKDLIEKLASMTDEQLHIALEKAGCKFCGDAESQTDYKNSLKNDY